MFIHWPHTGCTFEVLVVHQQADADRFFITLWLFNIAMGNGSFIDGLPKMVIFHGYVK
jgi:hypothetical protein